MGKSNYMERMRQYQKGSFKGMTTAQRKDRYIQDIGEQVYNEAYDKAFEKDRNSTYGLFTRQYIPYKLTSESDKVAKPIALKAKKSAVTKASDKFDEVTRYDDMLGRATNPYQYQPGGMRMYGDPKLGDQTFSNIVYQESEAGKQEALKKQMEEAQADNTAMEEANAALQRDYAIGNRVEASGQTALQAGAKGLLKAADPLKGQTPNWTNAMIPNAAGETASLSSGTAAAAKGALTDAATGAVTDAATDAVTDVATDAATKGAGKLATFASKYVNPAHAKAVSPYAIAGTIAGQGIKYLSDDDDATTMNFGEGTGSVLSGAASGAGFGSILGPWGTAGGAIIGGLYGLGKGLYQRNKARNTIGGAEDEKTAELNTIGANMRREGVKSRSYSGYDFGRTLAKKGGPRMYPDAEFDIDNYQRKSKYRAPLMGNKRRLRYGDLDTGGANVDHLNLDPRLVDSSYNIAKDINVPDFKVDNFLSNYLDKSSAVAFYNEAQNLPFDRSKLTPLDYHHGEKYSEQIAPMDTAVKGLSSLSDEDLKGLEAEISKLTKAYSPLNDEKSLLSKIGKGTKIAINQDWSGIKPYREKAGLSKQDIINLVQPKEDSKFGERAALSALRAAMGMKDFAYGGPRKYQNAGFDMSMLANNPIKNVPASSQKPIGNPNAPVSYMDVVKGAGEKAADYKTNVIDYAIENPLDATQIALGTGALVANKIPTPVTQGLSSVFDGVNAGISTYRSNKYANEGKMGKAGMYAGFAAVDALAAMPGSMGEVASLNKMKKLYNLTRPVVKNVVHDAQHFSHELSPLITGYKSVNAGKEISDAGDASTIYKNKFKAGGVKLPGGTMNPIPGSDAVEFKGKSHKQGGILLDEQTEVEGGETMDKVTMKDEGPSDYFFSKYLKLGGQSFAQRHKQLLKKGGTQQDIDALAQVQEKAAGRNPGVVEMERGGVRKYQYAGPYTYTNPRIYGPFAPVDNTYVDVNTKLPPYTSTYNETGYNETGYNPVPQGMGFSNEIAGYQGDDFRLPVTSTEESKEATVVPTNTSKGTATETATETDTREEETPITSIKPKPMPKIVDDATPVKLEIVEQIQELETKKETQGLTDDERKALNKLYRDVPMGAYAAGAAQMIPAAYAFLRKEKAQKLMGPAGRIGSPKLERVDFNKERSQNAADSRALTKSIETSGSGPAGIIAKMAAYGKKQTGDMQIAASESRANAGIQAQEAQMAQRANIANVQNAMAVDQVNTQMIESQRVADENRRYMALDAAAKSGAGLMGDVLSYKADERLARSLGTMGIYERERLGRSLLGKVNPRTGKFYTREDISEIYNINLDDPGITKEAEATKNKAKE